MRGAIAGGHGKIALRMTPLLSDCLAHRTAGDRLAGG
jgi:hypothetical protein